MRQVIYFKNMLQPKKQLIKCKKKNEAKFAHEIKKVLVFSFGNFFSRQFDCIALAGLEHLILLSYFPSIGMAGMWCHVQLKLHSYKLFISGILPQ